MTAPAAERIDPLPDGRFARLEAIEWWDQARLRRARIFVAGAGALGNEVLKNLALLGIGNVVVADLDHVERSNLSRSVLFRESDEGQPKAWCASRRCREIYPEMRITPIVGNLLSDVGLGWLRWADVVIGALDNREARVFLNAACARVARPWFDGGIEVLHGIVRGFAPPRTACYECTMSRVDWELLQRRRSCSLLARRAHQERGTPTTPTTASIVAALQTAEVVKHLHGLPSLEGRGLVFDGAGYNSYTVHYPISPDCPWHESPTPIESLAGFDSHVPLQRFWDEGTRRLGPLEAFDFAREIVVRLECSRCQSTREVFQPPERIPDTEVACLNCGLESSPVLVHSLTSDSPELARTACQLGLPARDIVWVRGADKALGFEIQDPGPPDASSSQASPETGS